MNEQEIEVKFYIRDLKSIQQRLESMGAVCTAPRVHETNLRFDTPTGELTAAHQVLRLRKDTRNYLTYKGPAAPGESVSIRTEIEFEVSNYETARHFLETLGYHVSIWYEKYRTMYRIEDIYVVLDELPYGNFIEIEAASAEEIQQTAAALQLNWEARVQESYLGLFHLLVSKRELNARNLCFEELKDVAVSNNDLGVQAADI